MSFADFPEGLEELGTDAFGSCFNLVQVSLPQTLKRIGSAAFYNTGLTSFTVPKTVDYLGSRSLYFNNPAEYIIIEDDDNELECDEDICNNVKKLIIGRNLSHLDHAFGQNVGSVTFTDNVTEICSYLFDNVEKLEEVHIGDNVQKINYFAFRNCRSLNKLYLGKSLVTIDDRSFENCVNLTKLYSASSIAPKCTANTFAGINKWDCTLYVPEDGITSYSSTAPWNEFFFIEPYDFTNGIEYIKADANFDGHYRVYDICGTMKMETTEVRDLKSLPVGIYIINGKKISIR